MTGPTDKTHTLKLGAADKNGAKNQGDLLHDNHSGYGGEALRSEREKAGVDIPTLSFELRIPKNYLRALESEDYDELPGTTYGFGYIKSYCKFLGIDDTPFLDTYKMRTAMPGRGPSYHFPDEALEPRMSGAMTAMLVVLALLSGYIGWQVYDRYGLPIGSSSPTVVTTVSVDDDASATNIADDAPETVSLEASSQTAQTESTQDSAASQDDGKASDTDTDTNSGTTLLAASDSDEGAVPSDNRADGQGDETNDVAEATTETATQQTAQLEAAQLETAQVESDQLETAPAKELETPLATQTTTSAQANVREPQEEIVISANSAAWVEVVSENGDVILSKLFQAGEEYIAPAEEKLYLSTGNAGGLVLMIPGLDSFQAGAVGEIIRDLPLSRESIRSRRSAVVQ